MKMLDSRQDVSARDDRDVVPGRKSVVNDWPPPQDSSQQGKNDPPLAADPFVDADFPF